MFNGNMVIRQAFLPFPLRIILHLYWGEHSNLLCMFGWLWLRCLSGKINLKCVLWGAHSCNLRDVRDRWRCCNG
jgi:hypothetical protein